MSSLLEIKRKIIFYKKKIFFISIFFYVIFFFFFNFIYRKQKYDILSYLENREINNQT
jgi:hypothetical protein